MKRFVEGNKHYSHLIESVGTWGPYQRRLLVVIIVSWFLAGAFETALFVFFDMGDPACQAISKAQCINNYLCKDPQNVDLNKYFPGGPPETIPYLLGVECDKVARFLLESINDIAPIIGLLLAGWLSSKKGNKRYLIIGNILMAVGAFILLKPDTLWSVIVGQILVGIPHYAVCILTLALMMDVTTQKKSALTVVAAMVGSKLGRIIMAGILFAVTNTQLVVLVFLLPFSILYFAVHCYYYKSPRHLIDTDIFSAFEVLKKIATKNNSTAENIDIENSFILSKFTVKGYSYWTIFKYRSLRIQTYSYCWIMCMMGVISQYPSYVLEVRLNRGYEEMAMSSFQLISLIPCFLFIDIYPRKKMCIIVSILLLLLCMGLPFSSNAELEFMIRVALLGLACITLSILAVFVTTSIVETYPHTVRTLALCLFFSCFLLGRMLESIAEFTISQPRVLEEMFAQCAFLLMFYMIPMKETKESKFMYEVEELNEEGQQEPLLE